MPAFKGLCLWLLVCACVVGVQSDAHAQVVAFGASVTQGRGVSTQAAYPARLEALLHAQGLDVKVANAGVNGDSFAGMLKRMDRAVPEGTRVVILQVGGPEARQTQEQVLDFQTAVAKLRDPLEARGIRIVMLGGLRQIIPMSAIQPDKIHPTAQGHQLIAEWLLPQVVAALRAKE